MIGQSKLAMAIYIVWLALTPRPASAEKPAVRFQKGDVDIRLTAGASIQIAVSDREDRRTEIEDPTLDIFARVDAKWTPDSGIVAGVTIKQSKEDFESDARGVDEIYAHLASDYGTFEIGKQDGPADRLAYAARVVGLGQIRGDFSRYAGSQALLKPLDTQDAFKIIYISPHVEGFRAGLSWSPKVERNGGAVDPTDRTILRDAIELGAQYDQKLGDWTLGASGSYVYGKADTATSRADLQSWSLGVHARRGPLRMGGAYVSRGDSNRPSRDFNQWEINGGVALDWGDKAIAVSSAVTQSSEQVNRLFGIGGYHALTRNLQLRTDGVFFRSSRNGRRDQRGFVGIVELRASL